eukprot:CAMPEP_0197661712 /NCGR_PEP_ID=MMETSP1338-20131121/51619_1 /TAXON_ID=43686 ORGANISM="Pelagodinium beii, Strain RCC1491" /NCGR_SAMPLE_ID=MMETSP1338 /ASSEMBLY_ACC=CAM_ASM_000754 /LENGTH=453 /DNA_ID=CAMNT_0043239319 /DNA_START=42 /DNA_END=1399 /DNA_ORIENTATION=-
MGPPLPPKPVGHSKGSGPAELGIYLNYTCPFSVKAYKTLFGAVQPKLEGRCRFTFYHQVQAWHPQGTSQHEAALAVAKLAGEEAFWKFSDALMAAAEDFYDVNVLDKTRRELWEELVKLAEGAVPGINVNALRAVLSLQTEANPGERNMGCGVTKELKWAIKHSRLLGIHVSPTTTLNGIVCDTSSSWTVDDWLAFFDTHLPKPTALPTPPEKADATLLRNLIDPLIIDARDPNEVESCKGGPALPGCKHVPLNMDGVKQSEHPTSIEEFQQKLQGAGGLPEDKSTPIITHCGNGGRGGKSAVILRQLGYWNAHNGGSPDAIRAARDLQLLPVVSTAPEKADPAVLKSLANPMIVDARDENEIEACKGGPAIPGSHHAPLNIDGVKQTERPTTVEEYFAKLQAAGCLPEDKSTPIITHCGSGGRGGKAALILRELGYFNVHNGGSPDGIRSAR